MSEISKCKAREILDSRGEKTIEISVITSSGNTAKASVPQGKSTGSREAKYVTTTDAVVNVDGEIAKTLAGMEVSSQEKIDEKLCQLDGTADKSRLGANAILGVSIACARASAIEEKVPLWKHLANLYGEGKPAMPYLFMNMINGGLHAGNNLDFQEYLVIPETNDIKKAVEVGSKIYKKLKTLLVKKFGKGAANVGDEGGFAPNFPDNLAPFEYLSKAAEGMGVSVRFGLDAAASGVKQNPAELLLLYNTLIKKFNLLYIEDPFGEDDVANFSQLTAVVGNKVIVTGDDLTVTNPTRIKDMAEAKAVNGVIIKPNQIGTLTETFEAIKVVRKSGWKIIVSHRSGETDDDFIADLAYAVGAYGFKLGAPALGERIAKYDRLLEIEKEAI